MKKALSLVLAAALAAGALSGCGSGSQSNTSGNNQGGGRKTQQILMALLLVAQHRLMQAVLHQTESMTWYSGYIQTQF